MQPILVAKYKDTQIYHDPNQKENTVLTMNKPKTIGYSGLLYIGDNGVCTREDGSPHTQEKTDYYVSCFIVNEPDPEKAVKQIEHMIDLQQKFSEYLINKARRVYEKLQELGIESTYTHNLKLRTSYNIVNIADRFYKITHHPEGHYSLGSRHHADEQPRDLKGILAKLVEIKKEQQC